MYVKRINEEFEYLICSDGGMFLIKKHRRLSSIKLSESILLKYL